MKYAVFLSHNSRDKPAVEHIARLLTGRYGLRCWLDKWNLIPGEPWQEGLEKALDECQTVAVFVGPSAISPWENEEMRSALETRASDRDRRVVPVLLPGAPDSQELKLPRFLSRLTWVDFRGGGLDDENALYRLYCGIQGIPPGAAEGSQEGSYRPRMIPPKVETVLRRFLRKRYIWMSAIFLPVLVLALLWYGGNADLPLFCGRDFTSAPGYIDLASQQRDNGRLACAVQNLEKALTVDPTPVEKSYIYYKLATISIVQLEPDPVAALEYADLGIGVDAAYQDLLHVSKGIAHCQLLQNVQALQEFNIFLELTPDPASLLANNVNAILGNLEKGEDMRDVCLNKLGAESLP